jgi:hypothetical protein
MLRKVSSALVAHLREPSSEDPSRWWLLVLASADIRHLHEDGLKLTPNSNWKTGVPR